MLELFVVKKDFRTFKISYAAKVVGAELSIHDGFSTAELAAMDSSAKDMLLKSSEGYLSQHVAIMRYIAGSKRDAGLLGANEEEEIQIDQWSESSWQELEVPAVVLLEQSYRALTSAEEDAAIKSRAETDVRNYLLVLEDHMQTKTFMVGERFTLADISIFALLLELGKLPSFEMLSFPSLMRWYMTMLNEENCKAALSMGSGVSKFNKQTDKWDRRRIRVKELLQEGEGAIGKTVTLKGWVRTSREADKGTILFVDLTDGSTIKSLQLVINSASTIGAKSVFDCGGAGASISCDGVVVSSPAKGQSVEIDVKEVCVLGPVFGGENGTVGGKNYPMAKKQHSLEFLREKAHLRPRSKVFSSAMRMRHAMAFATHKFFNDRGFVYVHTPLITAADCEGAGEQFVVTTLLPENGETTKIPLDKKGLVDYSKDFFGRRCCLTVSGQLNVETHACALSDVYTFGPTFRAEDSHTARHLAEFWMIEPEICFADLLDDMALAEDYVKFCTQYALDHCADDLEYFENGFPAGEKGLKDRLRNVVNNDFAQITYTEAVQLLQSEIAAKRVKFEVYPNWGDDLRSEHERYITEQIYRKPTIVTNYPKGIKAFYMKLNDDNETVAAMDILVPKIGELIGGSQREDNLETLEQRCVESGLKPSDIWWYADLRRYGTVPHAGFGLGFERLIMFVTGLENIRDVIPFPRVPGHAEF